MSGTGKKQGRYVGFGVVLTIETCLSEIGHESWGTLYTLLGNIKFSCRSKSTPPPTPIIEVVPLAEYEKLHPSNLKTDHGSLSHAHSSLPPQLHGQKYGKIELLEY